jgi:hypothetical protein
MSFFLTELRRLSNDLNLSGVKWCLVGGLGTSVYAEPRTTKDIDIAVVVRSDDDFEVLKSFLASRGYHSASALMHTEPTYKMGWRLLMPTSKGEDIAVDLLHRACGVEEQIVDQAVTLEILPKVFLPVASIGHLIAMKIVSHNDITRMQDQIDLRALIAVAHPGDIASAKSALVEISRGEGFAGRDFVRELASLLPR